MDKLALGQRVARAREDAGMTQEGLGRVVKLDRTAVSRLEKGERKLNVPELVEIAAALGRPLAYFVAESVPAAVSRRNDTAHAHSTTRLLDTELELFASDIRGLLEAGFLTATGRQPTAHVPDNHLAAEAAAAAARDRIGLGSGPILDLGEACERLGLLVFSAPLGEGGADGGCVEVDGGDRMLGAAVLNGDAPAGRRRMTLAHELGHWLFGDAYDAEASLRSEQMINSFAIHFLAPRGGVSTVWNNSHDWPMRDRALAVAAAFRLSWSAAVSQLRNLDLIGYDDHRLLSGNEPRSGDYLRLGLSWSDEFASPYLSPGFISATLNGYVSGRLTQPRALELLRGALAAEDLPEQSLPSLDDLRGAFAGHGG